MKKIFNLSVILLIMLLVVTGCNKNEKATITENYTKKDMEELLENFYKDIEGLPMLNTTEVDLESSDMIKNATGLTSSKGIDMILLSEPVINAQAHSVVLIKTNKDANMENMKKEILNNIDMRKWICVGAEQLYVTNYDSVIIVIMTDEQLAKKVLSNFKTATNDNFGSVLDKNS